MGTNPERQRGDERDARADASRQADNPTGSDVDDASEASFPASDPPAWMGLRVGGPPGQRRAASTGDSPPRPSDDQTAV